MEKPRKQANGLPKCNLQMLYMLDKAGGSMERGILREQLYQMGYGKYCVYEAFRRLEWQEAIGFIGSGKSKHQIVYKKKECEEELKNEKV